MILCRTLFIFLPLLCSAQDYTEAPTVKLLTAEFFGPRYPAADSDVRLSVDGGVDERVPDLGDLEIANGMPEEQLILHPGGRVVYDIPVIDESGKIDQDLIYVMIKPGKKDPPPVMNNPFTDKANITLLVSAGGGGDPLEVKCAVPKNHYSSFSSDYCILSIEEIIEQIAQSISVTVTVPLEETRDAVLWQIQLSTLDNSKRIKGTFESEARQTFRKTQDVTDFNTWLTMVSCVGKTGVGKSTVASLLSGNDTMFVAKSSSHGTTTLGADMSSIIPSKAYKSRIEDVLSVQLDETFANQPLFIIDSEGMKFRGDEVDFVTTGPVAIIANMIVWITEGRMRPPDILEELRHYLKGLDRISLGDVSSQDTDYGKFVVVLNKMQDSDQDYTDEQLCSNLLAWGQSDEDDATIAELTTRFKSISCVGFPLVHLEDNEDLGYGVIKRYPRFTNGIAKLSNMLIEESKASHNVKIGDQMLEMNSTNAETVIGLLIDGANQGSIDLTEPCNIIFSLYKEQVLQKIEKLDSEMKEATEGKCDQNTKLCSKCICEYRNSAVEQTANELLALVTAGVTEAATLCQDKPNVKDEISTLIDEMVKPWQNENMCSGIGEFPVSDKICDASDLQTRYGQFPDRDINIECDFLHFCETMSFNNSDVFLFSKKAYFSSGFRFKQEAPEKAADGVDNSSESGDGEDGSNGANGKNITLQISDGLLTSSSNVIFVTLNGGDGGHGGNGGNGKAAVSGINGVNGENGEPGANGHDGDDGVFYHPDHSKDPRYCFEVINGAGSVRGPKQKCCKNRDCCCGVDCRDLYKIWYIYTLSHESDSLCDPLNINGKNGSDGKSGGQGGDGTDGTDAIPASKGGNGGNGGSGGLAGYWSLIGIDGIKVNLNRIGGHPGSGGLAGIGGAGAEGGKKGLAGLGGKGGMGGNGGAAGACYKQTIEYQAKDNWHQSNHCHGFGHCSGDLQDHHDDCSEFAVVTEHPEIVTEQGIPGLPGKNGTQGIQGKEGNQGKSADKAPDGIDGIPGQRGQSFVYQL